MSKLTFGLDFGTTNSSLSVAQNNQVTVLPIDPHAPDPQVVRSMLFFFRRNLVYNPNMPKMRIVVQAFKEGDIRWEGEFLSLIGQKAVEEYLKENKDRHPGIRRKIFTGRLVRMRDADEARTVPEPEYYEEVDYGTGRLLQALKSTLRTSYKGSAIFGKFWTVEEMIGLFLSQIKEKAEKVVGQEIENIRAGRPVYFSSDPETDKRAQNRLKRAYQLAGFKKVNFEFEPVAAARQFALGRKNGQLIFVFDFGGGTLDTAVVQLGEKNKVLATGGVYIGGDLLNADIMKAKLWDYFGARAHFGDYQLQVPQHLYEALQSWYTIPSLNNPDTLNHLERIGYKHSDKEALERLLHLISHNLGFEVYEAIERAKIELSVKDEAKIFFQDGPINLNMPLSRPEFENIIEPRILEIKEEILRTLKSAGVEPEEIDRVVRTGGSSLIPVFEKMLESIFSQEKIMLFETFTSIAAGLALD